MIYASCTKAPDQCESRTIRLGHAAKWEFLTTVLHLGLKIDQCGIGQAIFSTCKWLLNVCYYAIVQYVLIFIKKIGECLVSNYRWAKRPGLHFTKEPTTKL